MERRYKNIISISDEVSSRVLKRQNSLRQQSLQQMNSTARREHEVLRAWRKIVLHNTHPWYLLLLLVLLLLIVVFNFSALWSKEEKRVMCWQLDPTEGPCRERRRLMRVPRNIDDRYILDEGLKDDKEGRLSRYTHRHMHTINP